MSPRRWERIKDLFEAASDLDAGERAEFLRRECREDQDLLSEVERLLEENKHIGGFLNEPLFGNLAVQVFPQSSEEILGGFRILKWLGSGGMGRVYEAYEIAKHRKVALKVLNADFALFRDDISRFEREAWIGGRLNHPNIVKAYGQGEISGLHYISMELLDGPSLATDILISAAELGQLPSQKVSSERIRKMIVLFAEVADAVHYVHDNGIIHRDIKPQNLLLTEASSRMLLSDFGLARDEAMSQLTRQNDFLGTIRYMSPEQLLQHRAKLDRRTDIWSLGVSLYQAVTLDLPYPADTVEGFLNAVSTNEPLPARARNPAIPRDLETVLMKCLEKKPARRYQNAAELRDDLRRITAHQSIQARRPSPVAKLIRFAKRHRKPIIAAAAVSAGVAALLLTLYRFASPDRRSPPLAIKPFTTLPGGEYEPKFSPDDKQVAFVWNHENERSFNLYVQNMDRSGLRRITSDQASEGSPAWSPDGTSIAFIRNVKSTTDSGVYLQPLAGGPQRKITSMAFEDHAFQRRLDWSPDGKYLALADAQGPDTPLAIYLLSPVDGTRTKVTEPVPGTQGDTAPAFSPDGKTLAFLRFAGSDIDDVYVMPMSGGTPHRVTADNTFISDYAWMHNGRELAVNSHRFGPMDLWIFPVDRSAPPRSTTGASNAYFIAVSPKQQLLAFSLWSADTNIWSADPVPGHPEKAKFREVIASTMDDRSGQYSPDGKRITFRSNQSGTDEIWVADSDGTHQMQLTFFDGPLTGSPHWSSDGAWIAFDSRPTGRGNIFVISAQGGQPRRVTTGPGDNVVPSWSGNGKYIYFASNRSGSNQIWKVPVEGESALHPAIQMTKLGGFAAAESPDGQWIYYAKGREVSGIWKTPSSGGEETLVTHGLQAGFWGYWALANDAIYYICCDAKDHCAIRNYSLKTRQSSVFLPLPKEPPFLDSGLSISRDSKSFLYPQVDHSQSNIMLGSNFR